MLTRNDFDESYAHEQLRRSKHPLRKIIKFFYLQHVLKDVLGLAVDLGCGAGQLLAKLPKGSLGLELNPHLVTELTSLGLTVKHYDLIQDVYNLSPIPEKEFNTLICSHLLEHFADAKTVMQQLFNSASRLGISRIIVIVPAKLGYASDQTHKTFIDQIYLHTHNLFSIGPYQLNKLSHFPFPNEKLGDYFIYQELKLVYDNQN